MLTGQRNLQELVISLNHILAKRQKAWPSRRQIRSYLQQQVGSIDKVVPLTKKEVALLAGGKPLVGVDGSVTSYGSGFPHSIYCFRALAASTSAPVSEGIFMADLFYPGSPEHQEEVEQLLQETRAMGQEISPAAAVSQLVREHLAALEVRAGLAAVEKYNPFLVLFDGGFLRYGELAKQQWEEYRQVSLERGVISVGVIEEIGTFDLARELLAGIGFTAKYTCDREILFGVLEPGEWLAMRPELIYKRGYYTCFARPGNHPQAIAYDFFAQQQGLAADIIPLFFSLTPQGGRGIPWWLDQVDAAVRITNKEVELLFDTCLDRSVRERLFVPHRERRGL